MSGAAFLALALAFGLQAQSDVVELLEQKTLQRIRDFDARFDGVLGVAAMDLATGRVFSHHGDAIFTQASVIKIPILIGLFRAEREGKLRFSDQVTLTRKDLVGGDGSLQHRLTGGDVTLTVDELIGSMIVESDNTATNRLIDLAGMERINLTLEELGLRHTRLRRKMMAARAVRQGEENTSTPLEMLQLVERIYHGKIIDEQACQAMVAILKQVKDAMRAAVPPQYEVASKWGRVDGVAGETGIVYLDRRPFALSVMSVFHGVKAENAVGPVTQIVFDHFERLAHSNRYGNRFSEHQQAGPSPGPAPASALRGPQRPSRSP
ncbi:MAG: serine hydrolase [Acidobacteria bacterium]|nr:serine hydrolase [Acidobacteriota bacterium]